MAVSERPRPVPTPCSISREPEHRDLLAEADGSYELWIDEDWIEVTLPRTVRR